MRTVTNKALSILPSSAFKSFACGELAYLAITSKEENPIRDKIAYTIYSKNSRLAKARRRKGLYLLPASVRR